MGGKGSLCCQPIGWVSKGAAERGGQLAQAEIQIDSPWVAALEGIEGFSHVWVLWWLDRAKEGSVLRVHPERRPDMPLVGVFATRSPQRPNPIALTAVRLLERDGNLLRVEGLDAYTGSPVLDIKPYLARGDLILGATGPEWIERLWRIHDDEQDG